MPEERDDRLQDAAITADQEREQARIDYRRRLEDASIYHQEKLEDLQRALERELEEQRIAEERKRADMEQKRQQEMDDLDAHWDKRYEELRKRLKDELELIIAYEKAKRAASTGISSGGGANLSGWPSQMSNEFLAGFRQSGGYVGAGVYAMGEAGREFVLANSTTNAAERVLGPLTQQGIMAAIGARNVTNNFAPQFNFSERDDARMIMGQVQQMIRGELLRIERGY